MENPTNLCRILYVAYFGSLLGLLPMASGGIFLFAFDVVAPHSNDVAQRIRVCYLAVGCLLVVLACGIPLVARNARRFLFANALFLMVLGCTLFLCECAARWFTPGWPELGLHGVPATVSQQNWGHAATQENGIGFNNWGQRDHPRELRPDPDVYRIGFIGDSFLEESTRTPLSVRVEDLLQAGYSQVEVLNLGVSATGPDEYFYRTRNIAIPLGCQRCVLFFYAGNDFVEPIRTLESDMGFAAVYPRGSVLTTVGLWGRGHVLTNERRPVLQAWLNSGNLQQRENQLHQVVTQSDDEMLRQALVNSIDVTFEERMRLADQLKGSEIPEFYKMLRQPDAGLFRSYYLSAALFAAATGDGAWESQPVDSAVFWVQQTNQLCRDKGVQLTLVVIPEAFQVDPRMQQQWAPVARMERVTKACRDAAEQFVDRAADAGLDVIDLQTVLEGVPGTYLNLDGHWSQDGVDLVADYLATRLAQSLPSAPAR